MDKAEISSVSVQYVVTAECPHCGESDEFNIDIRNFYEETICWNCGGEYHFTIPEGQRIAEISFTLQNAPQTQ